MRALVVMALAGCGNDHAPGDAGNAAELPCDVRDALVALCAQCHSSPPTSNAPEPLISRRDFFQPSSVAGESIAVRALARLRDPLQPMPPASEPAPGAVQIATLESWLASGAPPGGCSPLDPRPVLAQCPSGDYWQGGPPSEQMNPGKPCRACHLAAAPHFAYFFQGTASSRFDTADDCTSAPPPSARIEIVDAAGAVALVLVPDGSGNFSSASLVSDVELPYRARLVVGTRARAMTTPQVDGDCNVCHTEQGSYVNDGNASTPGRLVWP